jgi:hypothetical protein
MDAATALVDAFQLLDARLAEGDAISNFLYSITLLNCLPGNCRMMPFISRSNSVARTSQEFKPERSTMSSIGIGSSTLSSS